MCMEQCLSFQFWIATLLGYRFILYLIPQALTDIAIELLLAPRPGSQGISYKSQKLALHKK